MHYQGGGLGDLLVTTLPYIGEYKQLRLQHLEHEGGNGIGKGVPCPLGVPETSPLKRVHRFSEATVG